MNDYQNRTGIDAINNIENEEEYVIFLAALNAKRKELDARKDELKKEEQCRIMASAFSKCDNVLGKAADDAFDSFDAARDSVYISIPLNTILELLSDAGATVRFPPERLEDDDHDDERFLTVWFDSLDFEKMKLDEDNDLMIPVYY
jgi:hypothetical protein